MSLRIPVLIRKINNLSDARYGAGMGVQALSFSCDESDPLYCPALQVQAIMGWCAGVQLVLEQGQSEEAAFVEIVKEIAPTAVLVKQLLPQELLSETVQQWLLIPQLQNALDERASAYVCESIPAQPIVNVHTPPKKTVFVSPLLGSLQLDALLSQPGLGLYLYGGIEDRPGYKNFDDIAEILEQLEE